MAVTVKICGINSPEAMTAAIDGGAAYVGLMFYPPSPRFLQPDDAAALANMVPPDVKRVGVFVDEPDEVIARTLDNVPLNMLQFHGGETPARVTEIRQKFALPVMKAVKIAGPKDLDEARAQESAADILLFDAKAPDDMAGALPGGNALAFDWEIIAGQTWARPWMLSGGLDTANLAEAIRISGAAIVDVSSGVETAPGVKDATLISSFLELASGL
jgi:phosphoribosylanthranilate isomerase